MSSTEAIPQYELNDEQNERLEDISEGDWQRMRRKFQENLFFGAKAILGYDQLEKATHEALCAFMVREPSERRMVLMPRGFLKSTICTISDSVRLSTINPNIRILIQNEVLENATGFVEEICNHWESGELLRRLFPELLPERFSGPGSDWSKGSASIRRTTSSRVSTYTASGSGGSPQSKHFEVIKNDDLIGEKAKNSATEMKKAIEWSSGMIPLLDRLEDRIDYYGTRKTLTDVYAHVIEKNKGRIKVFVREPLENDETIFSKFPTSRLLQIMTDDPDLWAHDYMNNPVGKGGLDWGSGLVRHYSYNSDSRQVRFEHHLTGQLSKWELRELDIVLTVDPNSGKLMAPDKPAIVVHGISPDEQIFVLEAWSARVSPDGLVNKIFELAQRWQPRVVGIEDAGQQNTMYYFEKKCNAEGQYFKLQPLKHMNRQKEERIRKALDTPLKARRVYLLSSMLTLKSQLSLFPQLAEHNWDEIDALAYGPQVYKVGMRAEDMDRDEAAEKIILESRGLTGYGNSFRRRHSA